MSGGAYLSIIQGDSYVWSTNIAVDGVASNLQGSTLWFIANAFEDPDQFGEELFNVSTNTGQIAISGSNSNVVTITMNTSFTRNISRANVGHWALRTNTSGNIYTLDRGRIAVIPGMPSPL